MKRFGFLAVLMFAFGLLPFAVAAQQSPAFPLDVAVESAFVRAAPSLDATAVASVFMGDALTAIGRNVDGTWLQIVRPAGWMHRDTLRLSFDVALLPLTDATTGVSGVAVVDTGFSAQLIDDAPLRVLPDRTAEVVAQLPPFAVLPAVERTPDNQWVAVNYRGVIGWLPIFLVRNGFPVNSLPISPAYAADPRYPAVVVVPLERQLAQIDRLLAYIEPLDALASGVASYWDGLIDGEIFECRPLPPSATYYVTTPQDLVELPELRQQERRLREAVDDLNASLALTSECGILVYTDFRGASADANNARAIFRLVRSRMEVLRERIAPSEDAP